MPPAPMTRFKTLARLGIALFALYVGACLLGLALIIAGFRGGLFAGIGILFYRGLVLAGLATAVTFATLAVAIRTASVSGLGGRDAVAASLVALAFNVSFLVVVPVTADRSISIFLLGEMAAHPDAALTPAEASRLFKAIYVDAYRQIDRRLDEQTMSGNLEKVGDSYRITPRGRFVAEVAGTVAWAFDSRAGLAAPTGAASDQRDRMAARR